MGLKGIVAGVVAVAGRAAGDAMTTVVHTPSGAEGTYGPVPGTSSSVAALVEWGVESVRMADGTERMSIAKLTILSALDVKPDDQFRLPNGDVGYVLKTSGLMTDGTLPYVEAWLGSQGRRAS